MYEEYLAMYIQDSFNVHVTKSGDTKGSLFVKDLSLKLNRKEMNGFIQLSAKMKFV